MLTIKLTQSIKASRQSVMMVLLEHDKLHRFFDGQFEQTKPETSGQPFGGAGAIRRVSLHGQTFFEQIISATEQHICYRIIGQGPVSEHQGDIRLLKDGKHSQIEYSIRCKAPWWQPTWLVRAIIMRDIGNALKRLARFYDEC